ncbi:MAG: orotate phosphoribosyltransferase [Planctomycetota bacterium]|nr:MAG: orotate phosphoribosyltransferase [Planctomycetota bacterium]RLS94004.1 MAG: orotate phosphoribosyltransferase [Planctomycetota bacterium]
MTRQELAQQIAAASLLHGHFVLRSGRTSTYYLDKYLFSTQPQILARLGHEFAARIPQGTQRLAGAELGGIPLVSSASMATGLPCLFIRNQKKDYGTAKQLEGRVEKGDRVVIVEDVATTGGQALEAAKVLRDAGAVVVAIIATIDRLEGARENIEKEGIAFDAIFTVHDLGITPSA